MGSPCAKQAQKPRENHQANSWEPDPVLQTHPTLWTESRPCRGQVYTWALPAQQGQQESRHDRVHPGRQGWRTQARRAGNMLREGTIFVCVYLFSSLFILLPKPPLATRYVLVTWLTNVGAGCRDKEGVKISTVLISSSSCCPKAKQEKISGRDKTSAPCTGGTFPQDIGRTLPAWWESRGEEWGARR